MNQVGDGGLDQQAVLSPRTQHAIWADEDYDHFINDWQSSNGISGPLVDSFMSSGGFFFPAYPNCTVAGGIELGEKQVESKEPSTYGELNSHKSVTE